jgi:hypothetical protein
MDSIVAEVHEIQADSLEQEFLPKKTPLVRVVENNVRTLPLQKISVPDLEDPEEEGTDLLTEATSDVISTLLFDAAERIIERACKDEDVVADPDTVEAIELMLYEENNDEYDNPIGREREYHGLSNSINGRPRDLVPVAEKLLRADEDDVIDDEDKDEYRLTEEDKLDMEDIDPVDTFTSFPTANFPEEPMKKETEMKDNATNLRNLAAIESLEQAKEKGTIQYLKSVEGRVLTVLEAAISSDSQREAVKSLIKKEFRREMNRVNRLEDED